MFEDTACIVDGHFGKVTVVSFFIEEIAAVFPERLVYVHTVTVVSKERFWHECGRFTVEVSNHLNDILVLLDIVRSTNDVGEDDTDLTLSLSYFVVSQNNFKTYFFEKEHHFGSEVHHGVCRLDREVPAFGSWSVTHVAVVIES